MLCDSDYTLESGSLHVTQEQRQAMRGWIFFIAATLVAFPAAASDGRFIPDRTWTGFTIGVHASLTFGVQAGYLHQIGPIVIGVEADTSLIDVSERIDERFGPFDLGSIEHEAEWLATLRGRFGFSLGRLLLYGTGGLAFTDLDADTGVRVVDRDRDRKIFNGWTVGGGIEGMITPNLSARAEWLFAEFPKADFMFHTGLAEEHVHIDAHILRAALNYKFNF